MTRPRPSVAEVIRSCVDEFLNRYGAGLTAEQRRALEDLITCRTAALGGMSWSVPSVATGRSPTTPVATATARPAR
jgi:hypothetical protein